MANNYWVIASILLCSVTVSLQYQLFPTCNNTGSECLLDRECCGHTCCEKGYCTPSEACNPCRDMVCGFRERCYFETVEGITDQPPYPICAPMNPCHNVDCGINYNCNVIVDGDRPPTASCVPKIDLCQGLECSAFQQCYVTTDTIDVNNRIGIKALEDPLLPRPVCAYSNPCVLNRCKPGYRCVLDNLSESNIPTARCDPIRNPCLGVLCDVHEQCYITDMYVEDMTIPIGQCYPTDPCFELNCRDGFTCTAFDTIPPTAQCVLTVNPCENVTCSGSQKCHLEYVVCVTSPCYPIAQCAEPDPCRNQTCSKGYECINYYDDPYTAPTAKCVNPLDPCEDFICDKNQVCTFDQIYCFTTPCIPQPYCIDIDPCRNVRCAVGFECVPVSAGDKLSYGQCYPMNDPCRYTHCPGNSACVQLKKFPSLAICYDPFARALNCTQGVSCTIGYTCRNFSNPAISACIPTCETCPANTACYKAGYPPNIMCNPIIYL